MIPDAWRFPPYEQLTGSFLPEGEVCTTIEDMKKIVGNQAMCEAYRKNLLDLLDAMK